MNISERTSVTPSTFPAISIAFSRASGTFCLTGHSYDSTPDINLQVADTGVVLLDLGRNFCRSLLLAVEQFLTDIFCKTQWSHHSTLLLNVIPMVILNINSQCLFNMADYL